MTCVKAIPKVVGTLTHSSHTGDLTVPTDDRFLFHIHIWSRKNYSVVSRDSSEWAKLIVFFTIDKKR